MEAKVRGQPPSHQPPGAECTNAIAVPDRWRFDVLFCDRSGAALRSAPATRRNSPWWLVAFFLTPPRRF